jgi:hypothetical protein
MARWRRNRQAQAQGSEEAAGGRRATSSFDAYVARNEAGERNSLQLMGFSGVAALVLLAVAIDTGSQAAGLALAVPLVFFAYAFEQWQDARGGRESLRNDVIALSSVLYQDAATINKVLKRKMVHEYLQNLLQAALEDEEFGRGYWEQAVQPFIHEGEKGFRQDWHYRIDLIALDRAVAVPLPASKRDFAIDPDSFWRLDTVATFRQQVRQPHGDYYVGCTFSPQSLPDWFRDEGFFLRELVHLSPEQVAELASLFSDRWIGRGDPEAQQVWDAADTLFRCSIRIGDRDLTPDGVQVGELGIRWRYAVDADLQHQMLDGFPVRISTGTFQPRHQTYFPVNVTQPTRHPTVQFAYSQTSLVPDDVGANVFFSAGQPYRPELVEHDKLAKRIVLRTNREDWVFAGSGCIFVWHDRGAATQA